MCFRKVVVAGVVLAIGAVGSASASDRRPLVEGGIGDKPFVQGQLGKTRLGGYTEVHFRYGRSDGITEEITFEAKRFNLFTYTPVSDRLRVASEI